jgi:hypothetical protein
VATVVDNKTSIEGMGGRVATVVDNKTSIKASVV